MRKRIKNLILTVLIFAACITAVGFVPRDTGYDYTVGIVQLVRHSALDAATQGFTDALEAAMEEAGKTVKIDYQDAQNETVNCSIIANNFVAKKYDLIMANATAALQACYNATEEIPILGTSVTVYDVALGLKNYDAEQGTGTNVSGTSDLAPLAEQAGMIAELVPDARRVGLLYCSSEANSRYQVEEVARCLEEMDMGYECEFYAFSDSNDLSAVVEKMAAESEVVYVPTDNTVASNTQLINSICSRERIPVVAFHHRCGHDAIVGTDFAAGRHIEFQANGTTVAPLHDIFGSGYCRKGKNKGSRKRNRTASDVISII